MLSLWQDEDDLAERGTELTQQVGSVLRLVSSIYGTSLMPI